jgi:hypothetical protein
MGVARPPGNSRHYLGSSVYLRLDPERMPRVLHLTKTAAGVIRRGDRAGEGQRGVLHRGGGETGAVKAVACGGAGPPDGGAGGGAGRGAGWRGDPQPSPRASWSRATRTWRWPRSCTPRGSAWRSATTRRGSCTWWWSRRGRRAGVAGPGGHRGGAGAGRPGGPAHAATRTVRRSGRWRRRSRRATTMVACWWRRRGRGRGRASPT